MNKNILVGIASYKNALEVANINRYLVLGTLEFENQYIEFFNPEKGKVCYKCSRCGHIYQSKYTAIRHLKYECDVPRKFLCKICGLKFKHKMHAQTHMFTKHIAKSDLNFGLPELKE